MKPRDPFPPGHQFNSGAICVKASKAVKLPGMKEQAIVLGILKGSPEPYATWIAFPADNHATNGHYFLRLTDAHRDFGTRAAALYDRALTEVSLSLDGDAYDDLTPA